MNRDKSGNKILEKERLETVCTTSSLMSFAQRGSLCLEPYTYSCSNIYSSNLGSLQAGSDIGLCASRLNCRNLLIWGLFRLWGGCSVCLHTWHFALCFPQSPNFCLEKTQRYSGLILAPTLSAMVSTGSLLPLLEEWKHVVALRLSAEPGISDSSWAGRHSTEKITFSIELPCHPRIGEEE